MKITNLVSLLIIAGAASVASMGVAAQQSAVDKSVMSSKSLSDDDREFMLKAAGDGLYEIEVSKLAAKKSERADIKRFAAMLVKDHTAASEELKTIAVAKPLRIPADMPDGKKADLNMFLKADPAEFDKKYLQMVGLEEHRADIKLFEEQVRRGKDPQVKAFAEKTLRKLRMHLAAAEKLASNGGPSAAAK